MTRKTRIESQPLTSKRLEFDSAADAMEFYLAQGWTDGLPVVPPTPDKVRRFLAQAQVSPSEIVGVEPTRGRVITAEKVAANAVMAGCLPEYFPVVLAAVGAMSEPEFNLHAISTGTDGGAVLTVVTGPVAKELGLNSAVSVFGPGHRANATIGRAVQFVVSNVTGAVSGVLDKATFGHGGKYTWCIAEADEVSPWQPLHVERGFGADQSAVTVFAGISPILQATNPLAQSPEAILASLSDAMFASGGPDQGEIVVVLCPEHIGYIKSAGWSKGKAKSALFDFARRKASDWVGAGMLSADAGRQEPEALRPVAKSPDSITVIVAGGPAGAFSAIIPLWGWGIDSRSVTREVWIPA